MIVLHTFSLDFLIESNVTNAPLKPPVSYFHAQFLHKDAATTVLNSELPSSPFSTRIRTDDAVRSIKKEILNSSFSFPLYLYPTPTF